MKKISNIAVSALLLASISILGSSCSSEKKVQDNKTNLVVAITEEPPAGFNPATKWPWSGDPIFQNMLYKYDKNGNVTEDFATSCEVSSDNKIYTVKVRSDAVCSDGVKLTANDVAFSYRLIADTSTWVDYSFFDKAEVQDEQTVKIFLKRPNSMFKHIMAMTAIIPEHAYDKATYGQNPVGAGPFVLKQWDKGEKIIVEANPHYYGKKPEVNTITFLFVNTDTALALAQRGEVDVARLSVNLGDINVKGYEKKIVKAKDSLAIYMPAIACGAMEKDGVKLGNDVTSDVAIRKACAIALDRNAMVQSVVGGYGQPLYTLFEGTRYGTTEVSYKDNDRQKAIQILEEAGWKDSDNDGIREKNGVKAQFTLYSVPQDQTYSPRQGVCLAMQQQLKKIGIQLDIIFKQFAEVKKENLLFQQCYMTGMGGDNPLDVFTSFHSSMMLNGSYNPSLYSNPTVDGYIDSALNASSEEEAMKYLKLAQWDGKTGTDFSGDCVWLPILRVNHIYLVRNGIKFPVEDVREAPHRGGTWTVTEQILNWGFEQ
ncbi:MAG: ABC transporter substrate-binding protein [Treponema sp.]|nr:ABC transporter substrate-binding protein [Treponema sp.]